MGSEEERKRFVGQVRKACRIARKLRELGVRPYGVVRIDSACGVADWAQDPEANQGKIAQTFSEACDVAEDFGERLAAEGEICWGGMHSWKKMVDLLQRVNRPKTLGFQADMAHTLLYILGYNAPEDAILPPDWDWSDPHRLNEAMKTLTSALRPWTIDFHVAQNDATVHGSGTHDKTGHHCLPNDPNGKLTIPHHAGYWLHGEDGRLTKAFRHICWDGCMFPNAVMMKQETWNDILRAMIAVRDAHGWREEAKPAAQAAAPSAAVKTRKAAKPARTEGGEGSVQETGQEGREEGSRKGQIQACPSQSQIPQGKSRQKAVLEGEETAAQEDGQAEEIGHQRYEESLPDGAVLDLGIAGCRRSALSAAPANQLTDEEKAAGWKLLFDGKTTQGWRTFKKQTFPDKGWVVEDGWLHCLGKRRRRHYHGCRVQRLRAAMGMEAGPCGQQRRQVFHPRDARCRPGPRIPDDRRRARTGCREGQRQAPHRFVL